MRQGAHQRVDGRKIMGLGRTNGIHKVKSTLQVGYLCRTQKSTHTNPNPTSMQTSRPLTLGEFLVAKQSDFPFATGELSALLSSIRLAAKVVNR